MPSIEIVPATDVPFTTFTSLLNRAYSDYYIPLDMDTAQLQSRVQRDNIDMTASVVALDAQQPVGLGMLARRGPHAWIGGVGVLPAHRSQGIGRQIMDGLLHSAHKQRVQRVQLEVIRQNTRAEKLYSSLGFQHHRLLHLAEGDPAAKPHPSNPYTFQTANAAEALQHYERLHTVPSPWQRHKASLLPLVSRLSAYLALDADENVLAYALGIFRADALRFLDLAVQPAHQPALTALINHLHQRYPHAIGSIINIAEDDPAWQALSRLSYQPTLTQHEMFLNL